LDNHTDGKLFEKNKKDGKLFGQRHGWRKIILWRIMPIILEKNMYKGRHTIEKYFDNNTDIGGGNFFWG